MMLVLKVVEDLKCESISRWVRFRDQSGESRWGDMTLSRHVPGLRRSYELFRRKAVLQMM